MKSFEWAPILSDLYSNEKKQIRFQSCTEEDQMRRQGEDRHLKERPPKSNTADMVQNLDTYIS